MRGEDLDLRHHAPKASVLPDCTTPRQPPNLNVLHLDAHPDLYDELDGNRYSHTSPFLRAMEERLIGRLVQFGIRTATPSTARTSPAFWY